MQYVRGLDLIRQGQYPAAVEALTQAMQASPDPSFVLARGVAECLGGWLREAIADFAQGRAHEALGRSQDAMRAFQGAIDLTGKPGVPGIISGREGGTTSRATPAPVSRRTRSSRW